MLGREGRAVRRPGRREILIFLTVLGPGLITAMVDNDAGGIATYSVAGARFGYELLWVLVFTAILLTLVQEMTVRMGMVTGKGLAALIRERFSLRLTAFIMLILLITNFANTVSNFAGLAASMQLFGVPSWLAVPPLAALIWWLVVKGTYKRVEKVFLIASLVYISYIIAAFLAKPDWGEVGKALVTPSVQFNTTYLVIMVTMIGTTIAPWMQFYQQAAIVDKGLDASKLRYERLDTGIGGHVHSHSVRRGLLLQPPGGSDHHHHRRGGGGRPRSRGRKLRLIPVRRRSPGRLPLRRLYPSAFHGLHRMRGIRLGVRCGSAVSRGAPLLFHLHILYRRKRRPGDNTQHTAGTADGDLTDHERYPAAGDNGVHADTYQRPRHHGGLCQFPPVELGDVGGHYPDNRTDHDHDRVDILSVRLMWEVNV
jgi:hypothetical protein